MACEQHATLSILVYWLFKENLHDGWRRSRGINCLGVVNKFLVVDFFD